MTVVPIWLAADAGYKLCIRIYLNGDGIGRSTHVSLFLVVMRGNYDPLVTWPFNRRVTFTIPAQSVDSAHSPMIDSFRPDPSCSSFHRPTSDMNVAAGFPKFMPVNELDNARYVKDDTLFVSVSVDMATEITRRDG